MQLIKLVAKNFKKLSDFTANFESGLNVIVGENAQGKSTLLQAIEASLFGVTVVPGKKENIPTWGQNNFGLELHFYAEGSVYVLTRNKSTAKLLCYDGDNNELLVANGNTPVTAYIEELLGLSAKDFNLFMQSKQGETSGVLTFGATALNQKVEEFAGISVIDDVAKRANELASSSRAVAAGYEVDEAVLIEANEEVQAATSALEAANAANAAATDALTSYPPLCVAEPAVSSQALTDARRAADKKAKELVAAQSDVTLKTQAAVSAEEALDEAGQPAEAEHLEGQVAAARKSAVAARSATNKLQAEQLSHEQADLARESAQAAFADACKACDPVRLVPLLVEHTAAAEIRAEVSSEAAVLAARLSDMKSMQSGAVCPTCNSKLTDHDPAKLAEEIAAIEAAQSNFKAELADLDKIAKVRASEIDKLQAAARKYDLATEQLSKANAAVAGLRCGVQAELEAAREAQTGMEAELAALISSLENAEANNTKYYAAARRLARAEGELEIAEGWLIDVTAQQLVAPTDVEIDTAAQAEAEYRQEKHNHERALQQLNNAADLAFAEVGKAQIAVKAAESRLHQVASDIQKGKDAAARADRASRLARFLRDRRQAYLAEVWATVLASASRQVSTASRGLITRITNDSGEFCFEEDGVLAPVACASGAQKAFIGSAVRIGLARALYGSDSLLIFDEPTESMSERNASGLAASLTGAASQLLLITHREQDQSLAANIIQVGV